MKQCPICYTGLEVRECAPCDDCGWDPEELRHLEEGQHTYSTWEVYKGLRLTLCDFCSVDFGSYLPEYFGFKDNTRISLDSFEFVRNVENPAAAMDKFCPECSARLRFLEFLRDIREINNDNSVR